MKKTNAKTKEEVAEVELTGRTDRVRSSSRVLTEAEKPLQFPRTTTETAASD